MIVYGTPPPKRGKGGRRLSVTYHADGTKTVHYPDALKPIRKFIDPKDNKRIRTIGWDGKPEQKI